jgi:signal transduction histidine kinase
MTNQLSVANDKLREMDNTKTEFISIASHQLRTPLTSIKGYVSLILEGSYGVFPETLRGALNNIYTSTERLIALVEDLLDVSRIESGRMVFDYSTFQIEDACKEIASSFSIKAGNKNLELKLELPEKTLSEVMTDRARLVEVISNLVDNAVKYTDHGGITMRVREKETKMQVEISDTGIGVPKTEIPYLFAKFSRGKDISRLNASGSGLGLHYAKKVIEALKGTVWVESEGEGKGSKFVVEFPIKNS